MALECSPFVPVEPHSATVGAAVQAKIQPMADSATEQNVLTVWADFRCLGIGWRDRNKLFRLIFGLVFCRCCLALGEPFSILGGQNPMPFTFLALLGGQMGFEFVWPQNSGLTHWTMHDRLLILLKISHSV